MVEVLPFEYFNSLTKLEKYDIKLNQGIYVLPTEELVSKLDELISPEENAIEICSGMGIIGRELNMKLTDSMIQEKYRQVYYAANMDIIHYPKDVEKLEALEAVEKYRPDCVLSCYGTPIFNGRSGFECGVDYMKVLKKVKHLVAVSNDTLMKSSPIMKLPHYEYRSPYYVSSTFKQLKIYEWKNTKN